MSQNQESNPFGEYIPEPFEFKGNPKGFTILACVVAWVISVVILGNTVLQADENDFLGVLNFVISTAVALLVYAIGYNIGKALYAKEVEQGRERFEREKAEAIPYTICEFCGGALETKFYQSEDTPFTIANHTKLGVQTFACNTCKYLVTGHTCTTYASPTVSSSEYTLIFVEAPECSAVTEKQVQEGRLYAYMRQKKRVVITTK